MSKEIAREHSVTEAGFQHNLVADHLSACGAHVVAQMHGRGKKQDPDVADYIWI